MQKEAAVRSQEMNAALRKMPQSVVAQGRVTVKREEQKLRPSLREHGQRQSGGNGHDLPGIQSKAVAAALYEELPAEYRKQGELSGDKPAASPHGAYPAFGIEF